MSTLTITEFLEARIAEDEAEALPFRNELGDTKQWRCDEIGGAVRYVGARPFGLPDLLAKFEIRAEGAHVARWDPSRVLAECAAKRAIMGVHRPHDHGGEHGDAVFCDECQWDHGDDSPRIDNQPVEGFGTHPCRTLALLAGVYGSHPDYREAWAL